MDVKDYHKEIELLASDVIILATDGHIPVSSTLDDLKNECSKRLDILCEGWE